MLNKEIVTKALHEGVCTVTFTKVNGDERVMNCTLNADKMPKMEEKEGGTKKKPNPDVLSVWDVTANGWRSFRWDSLKSFEANGV